MKNKLFALTAALIASTWSASVDAASQAAPLESPQTQAAAQALVKGARAAVRPALPDSDEAVGQEEPGDVTGDEASRPPTQVSEGVWRSSRPNTAALERLYGMRVKTILNLEGGGPYSDEKKALRRIEEQRASDGRPDWHIASDAVPMSGIGKPSFEQIDRALAELADPAKRPILVHCKHGEDRTGVVVAAYRTEIEKRMTLDEAVDEAKSMNCCHLVLIGENALREFLKDYHAHRQGQP